MDRFEHIRVQGFRRLRDLSLDLRDLCVLIGANGCGKTSFLDVLSLLSASAVGSLGKRISEFEGISSILTLDGPAELRLSIQMGVPNHNPLVYELVLARSGISYMIAEESLTQVTRQSPPPFMHVHSAQGAVRYFDPDSKRLVQPTWEHMPLETSLCQVPKMFREPEEFRSRLASSTYYHSLNVESLAPIRLPQPLRPAELPGLNGEALVSCLFTLRESHRDRFDSVEDALRAAFPGFVRLDFPPVAAGTLAMTWRDTRFTSPLYMHQLSEGTLRFLWLATLLQSPGLSAITLIDEPEISLHPELLSLLAGLMREASTRTQIIVATHSERFIRFLRPEEVVLMDVVEDGSALATWADSLDLEEWLREYSLDELWMKGQLGARS
ncbi:MAG: hypothetical protein GHCLOJNM_01788 [bacterium]|nr:hypothetical protein [bacterium]